MAQPMTISHVAVMQRTPNGVSEAPAGSTGSNGDSGAARPGSATWVGGASNYHEDARLLESLERMGAADEVLTAWASVEAKILIPPPSPPPRVQEPAHRTEVPPSIPDTARWVCLRCMQTLVERYGMSREEWFDAVMLFDSCVCKVGADLAIDELPALCAVLIRMQWNDHATENPKQAICTDIQDWIQVRSWVAENLARAGHPQAMDGVVSASEDALMVAENALLGALQWRVHVPNLAKWVTVYFKRLQVFAHATGDGNAGALLQEALDHAARLTVLQAPSRQCPPQRLARGLLIVLSESSDIMPVVAASERGRMEAFEAVMGSPARTLQEDYDLATHMLQLIGFWHTERI